MRELPRVMGAEVFTLSHLSLMNGLDVAGCGHHHEGPEDGEILERLTETASLVLGHLPGPAGAGISGSVELVGLRRACRAAAPTAFISRHLHRHCRVLKSSSITSTSASLRAALDVPESPQIEALKGLLADADGFAFDTIGALLQSTGSQGQLTELLHVHRTTLHYRLAQIEQHTGLDLQAPADLCLAADLWLRVAVRRSPLAPLLTEYADPRATR